MDRLLTTAEVAEMVRAPVATLRYWRYKGVGPKCAKVGPRRVLYKESEVLEWIQAQFDAANTDSVA